ncbi:MAG: hypothetical protein WCP34_12300 [Pseudomonadota bacterium]
MFILSRILLCLLILTALSSLNAGTQADQKETLLFAVRHYQPRGASHFTMWQASPGGSSLRRVHWPDRVPLFALVAPDGRHYLYASSWARGLSTPYQEPQMFFNGAPGNDPGLWLVSADGKERHRLMDQAPAEIHWVKGGHAMIMPDTPNLLNRHGEWEAIAGLSSVSRWLLAGAGLEFTTRYAPLYRPPLEYALTEQDEALLRVHLKTRTAAILALSNLSEVITTDSRKTALISPDGSRMAFVRRISTDSDEAAQTLAVLDLTSGAVTTLPDIDPETWPNKINHFEWSPAGNLLLLEYYGGLSGGPHAFLYIFEPANGKLTHVDDITADTAQWSPSGRWLAYQTLMQTRPLGQKVVWSSDIGVVKADGSSRTYLTSGTIYACLPRWVTRADTEGKSIDPK